MKSIVSEAIIEGVRARKDRSLGLTISTPELSPAEKVVFMELQGIICDMKLSPKYDNPLIEEVVDKEINQKTQSQRIRSVLFLLYRQEKLKTNQPGMLFDEFYRLYTEKYIEYLKSKLD